MVEFVKRLRFGILRGFLDAVYSVSTIVQSLSALLTVQQSFNTSSHDFYNDNFLGGVWK